MIAVQVELCALFGGLGKGVHSVDAIAIESISHQGERGLIPGGVNPGFSHVGIVPDETASWKVFSGSSRFPCLCIPTLLYTQLALHSSTIKTSMLRWPPGRVIGGKTARQFSALCVEAIERVHVHVSVAPSAPTLSRLRRAECLQPGDHLKAPPKSTMMIIPDIHYLPESNWAPVHNVCSVVVTPLESRRATSCGYNSSHPVWHALYECVQDIHGDSSPFLLQPFHELSNVFWPLLTSPYSAIQFVPKMF
ncbi:hypothetical protein PR048_014176 [Dryococelus australis]|uniref:Uncharacterized protein n=1 Tax=Dryococelus australis TaxID=614101 RepID=A0ABQ9HDH2_9NEOP|nr:hypothetical protein PR048_014176 [Dryococelus australis]